MPQTVSVVAVGSCCVKLPGQHLVTGTQLVLLTSRKQPALHSPHTRSLDDVGAVKGDALVVT